MFEISLPSWPQELAIRTEFWHMFVLRSIFDAPLAANKNTFHGHYSHVFCVFKCVELCLIIYLW